MKIELPPIAAETAPCSPPPERAFVLEMVNRVALDILSGSTGVEALRSIVEAARTLAGARYAALGVARMDGQGLSEFVTTGLPPETEAIMGPRPKGEGILGLLLHSSEPLRLDNLTHHPHSAGFPAHHPPMDSFLGVPIRRGNVVLGSLYLTNKQEGGAFTEADEAAVQALGAYAAVAIHNLHLLSRQRALVSGLIDAQEEERRAVAYDLHDGLTQYVMASHAHLESFKRARSGGKAERAERELEQGLRYLKEAVVESRRLVNGLRSLALDDLGLAGALEQLVAEEKTRAGWNEVEFRHNIASCRYHKTLETTVYRVAQEALTNVRKHSGTDQVGLSLLSAPSSETTPSQLTLEVQDWGCGFVPERVEQAEKHVGLHGMAERVQLLSGIFEVHSAPGRGTRLCATFPLLEPSAEAGDSHAMDTALLHMDALTNDLAANNAVNRDPLDKGQAEGRQTQMSADSNSQPPNTEHQTPNTPSPISVMLVDDHAIWRGGVRSMLEDTEFVVVGEAGSGREALEVARQVQPRLTLLDIRMAGGDGLAALVALKQEHPRMAVVMLTTYDNPTYMARAVAGGAAGYLLKGVEQETLLEALRCVSRGETLLSPQELVHSLRGISEQAAGSDDLTAPLTDREQEVLRLLSTGLNNRDMAALLFVAESTIKTHVEHIIGKLGVSDRVQAAVWAARHGLATIADSLP